MPEVFDDLIKRPRMHSLRRLTNKKQDTLRKLDEYNELKNFTKGTRINELQTIAHLGNDVKKEYQDMTKDDVNDWLNRNIKPSSRQVYQVRLNKFFEWLGKNTNDWFEEIENAGSKPIDPSSLWSPTEVYNLVKVYPEIQNRALSATLFDSGSRKAEICSMNINHVETIAGNIVVYFPSSKTQPRRVELLFATPYLLPWYNIRKSQCKSEDEPLFLSKCNRNRNQRLTPGGVTEIIKYGCKLLGTKKRLTPHLLRHSMTSYLRSKGYPDALHRIRLGLRPGSTVLERYTHVTDEQVSIGAKKAFGIKDIEVKKQEPNPLLPLKCPRCGELNQTSNTLCSKCYYSLCHENVNMEIEILEMFKTEFAKATNIDVLFNQYRYHKLEVTLLEHFKGMLNGSTNIETDEVRQHFTKYFSLTEDQILEFLGTMQGEKIIEIEGDDIIVLGLEKLNLYIQSSKDFLKLGNKYATSKKGGE